MSKRKAIVTIVVGDAYAQLWQKYCQKGWEEYAAKYDYDVICIDAPLDNSERARQRSVSWQKCLILGQKDVHNYDQVVWVDADVIINPSKAPCIAATVPVDRVGAVDAWASPAPELAQLALDRLYDYWGEACVIRDRTAQDYYASYGITAGFDQVVQAGVMVMSPRHHRRLMERIYREYEETGKGNFEMRPLSYELLKADCVHWLDYRFNLVWLVYKALYYPFLLEGSPDANGMLRSLKRKLFSFAHYASWQELNRLCIATAFRNSFFLHFAGSAEDMEWIGQH